MSDDVIDPPDPEYKRKAKADKKRKAKEFQEELNKKLPEDDLPVKITVRQAQKIAAIMRAVADGNSGYISALHDASEFLFTAANETTPNTRVSRPSAKQ